MPVMSGEPTGTAAVWPVGVDEPGLANRTVIGCEVAPGTRVNPGGLGSSMTLNMSADDGASVDRVVLDTEMLVQSRRPVLRKVKVRSRDMVSPAGHWAGNGQAALDSSAATQPKSMR